MKKILIGSILSFFGFALYAQTTYNEAEKFLKKEKVVKMAKKEAKKWWPMPSSNSTASPRPSTPSKSLVKTLANSRSSH